MESQQNNEQLLCYSLCTVIPNATSGWAWLSNQSYCILIIGLTQQLGSSHSPLSILMRPTTITNLCLPSNDTQFLACLFMVSHNFQWHADYLYCKMILNCLIEIFLIRFVHPWSNNAMHCNLMQCNTVQCNTIYLQYNILQCNTIHCNTIQCNTNNTIHYPPPTTGPCSTVLRFIRLDHSQSYNAI